MNNMEVGLHNVKKLFIFLAIAIFCGGAGKAKVYPPNEVLLFKGLDDTSSLLTVQDGRSIAIQNVELSVSNSLSKRKGYNIVNGLINDYVSASDQFSAITGLHYIKESSGTEYRYAISGRKMYYDNSGTWDLISGNIFTYDKNNQFVWANALDYSIFTNDVDVPYKAKGTAVTALDVSDLSDTLTKVKTIAWFKNYLVMGNTVEAGVERTTRFRWSDVGTIETYQDDNFIDIAALGGQEIQGVAELRDNLFIFLTDSIWKASLVGGNEIFVISKVVDGIGCISKSSIQNINLMNQQKGLIFLSKDKKIYFFDGNSVTDLSLYIAGTMSGLVADRLQYAVSVNTGTSYLLDATTGSLGTKNNLLLEFEYEIGEWTKHVQIDANAMARVVDSDNLSQIYFGNYDSAVYVTNTTLNSDVTGQTGGVSSVITYDFPNGTATGLQYLLTDDTIAYAATGAIITLTAGTGVGQEKVVVANTATGLIMDSAFSTTPDGTTSFSIGTIKAHYETKWYDMAEPSMRKLFVKLYLWVEESSGADITIEESLDFASVLSTKAVSLQGTGGVWGTAIWGTDLWGGQAALFKIANLNNEGRYIKLRFENEEIDEYFNLLGYNFLYWRQDVQ